MDKQRILELLKSTDSTSIDAYVTAAYKTEQRDNADEDEVMKELDTLTASITKLSDTVTKNIVEEDEQKNPRWWWKYTPGHTFGSKKS